MAKYSYFKRIPIHITYNVCVIQCVNYLTSSLMTISLIPEIYPHNEFDSVNENLSPKCVFSMLATN